MLRFSENFSVDFKFFARLFGRVQIFRNFVRSIFGAKSEVYCLQCEEGMFIDQRVCKPNNIINCQIQWKDQCLQCQQGYILLFGKCIDKSELNCDNYNDEEYYKDIEGCFPRTGSNYQNCKSPKTSSNECLECNDNYELINANCYEK